MPALFKRSNGIYYHVTSFHGRRIWRSTGVRSRFDALRVVENNLTREKPNHDLTLSQFGSQFLKNGQSYLAATTILLYSQGLRTFIRLIGDYNLRHTP